MATRHEFSSSEATLIFDELHLLGLLAGATSRVLDQARVLRMADPTPAPMIGTPVGAWR